MKSRRRPESHGGEAPVTGIGGRLLIAADPDSLCGKAKKARDYGVPIVHEQAFLNYLLTM